MKFHHFHKSRFIRWIFRFRKRCGYGIHSPFAFNLVTGVIYEKDEYYAYVDLTRCAATMSSSLRMKDNRLLFRLANFHQPNYGIVLADHFDLSAQYLKMGVKHCQWHIYSHFNDFSIALSSSSQRVLDMAYIDASFLSESLWPLLIPCCYDHTLLIIHGIHESPFYERLWSQWIVHPKVRVTFDLYDFGLMFFEERLNKENYVINYY